MPRGAWNGYSWRMQVLRGLDALPSDRASVVVVGNFDGVHRGHQELLRTARQRAADLSGIVVAVTFDPHPTTILRPSAAPQRLNSLSRRIELLSRHGADSVLVLETNAALLATPARDFIEKLATRCGARAFVEGPTFHFGRRREGDIQRLIELGGELGFEVHVVPGLTAAVDGRPVSISSSAVRERLAAGDARGASILLGRPHAITGRVGSGASRGAAIGFPTINLTDVDAMTPAHAVYAGLVRLADGSAWPTAVNIGPQPTFDDSTARIEAHLIGFHGDLRDQIATMELWAFVRPQQRFDGVESLVRQIREDCDRVRQIVGESFEKSGAQVLC